VLGLKAQYGEILVNDVSNLLFERQIRCFEDEFGAMVNAGAQQLWQIDC
jgi:hypothetical protein